jgi:thiol-disulfide isomerase/thioredoxin
MKIAVSLVCALALAVSAHGQAKKFKTLGELEASFDKDKVAALEAFLKDKAGKDETDLKAAEGMIPSLKVAIAMKGTDAAALKDAHAKLIAQLEAEDLQRALETTSGVGERLVEINDFDGAKAGWTAFQNKYGDHPQAGAQVTKIAEGEISKVDQIGKEPKAFKVKDLADKDLSVESFKGKVVLIDFWATWCGPCIRELPNLLATYKKYHDKGFEIIGISLDKDDKSLLDKFLAAHPDMTWAQFYDGKGWKNELAQLYGIQSIPATYLIDRTGKVHRIGLRGKALDTAIEKLLSQGEAKKG